MGRQLGSVRCEVGGEFFRVRGAVTRRSTGVSFFMHASLPPIRNVFFSNRVFSTCGFTASLVGSTGYSLILVSGCMSRSILLVLDGQGDKMSTAVCARGGHATPA